MHRHHVARRAIFSLCAIAAGLGTAAAQTSVAPDWSRRITGESPDAMAVDAANQSYVVSTTSGTARSMVLTKLGESGAVAWRRVVTDAGVAGRGTAVINDLQGNAIVTGAVAPVGAPAQGAIVAKFDPSGNLLWRRIGNLAHGQASAVATDAQSNVFVLEYTGASAIASVSKVSATGALQWTYSFADGATSIAPDIRVLASGHVVVTDFSGDIHAIDASGNLAWSARPLAFSKILPDERGGFFAFGTSDDRAAVVRYGASFNEEWRQSLAAPISFQLAALDSQGQLALAGPGFVGGGDDWHTVRLDASGAWLWTQTYGDWSTNDFPQQVTIGDGNAVFVGGKTSVLVPDATGLLRSVSAATVVKYSSTGMLDWVVPATANVVLHRVASSANGGVVALYREPAHEPTWMQIERYPQSGLANRAPNAVATASTSAGLAPLVVQFDGAASGDPDGRVAAYQWDFGDGTSSTIAKPSHTYAAGTFTARLKVVDNLGAESVSAPIAVTVGVPPPQPAALVLPVSTVGANATITATIVLTNNRGATVSLLSTLPSAATVPASVVVPAGATSATFTVTTGKPRKNTMVSIKATANGATVSAALTVRPR